MARVRQVAIAPGAVPVRSGQAVLGEGGAADEVQSLDLPVATDQVVAPDHGWACPAVVPRAHQDTAEQLSRQHPRPRT